MKLTNKLLILALALPLSAAAITPLWMRDVKISPDGKTIAFTYKGDIYTVPVTGGTGTRLTSQPTYESTPIWSPDSKSIAFADDRNGSLDIYVMPVTGGAATRLTTHSATETPESFTPDGRYVLFSGEIQDPVESALFPSRRLTELYRVPVEGGKIELVVGTPVQMPSISADGTKMLYQDQKGMEDEWRKHHTSSVTRDIWLYDTTTGQHTNLTDHAGEDRNPVLSPDGKTVFFLSERDGKTFNVYSFPLDNPQTVTAVTAFEGHPVRFLSQSADGTLAFTYNGEIYTKRGEGAPQKVAIDIVRDDDDPLVTVDVKSGATMATVSPDGKQIAFIKRGELFVTSDEYATTKQITHTVEAEADPAWAPDNRTIAYTSERDGHWNIYTATISRKDDPNFPNATLIDEAPLLPATDNIERTAPQYSPDGKEIAFIQDRNRLMVMDLATKQVRQVTDGSTYSERDGKFTYSWSPDSKWFTIEAVDNKHNPYCDIAIVSASGGPVTNITQSGYFDENPRWVLDGNAILFLSERYGMRNHASWGSQYDVMLAFLNNDAYNRYSLNEEDYAIYKEAQKAKKEEPDKKAKKGKDKKEEAKADSVVEDIKIDFEGIDKRIVRVTPYSSQVADAIMSKDGETLYFLASTGRDDYDLWSRALRKGDMKIIGKVKGKNPHLAMDKEGNNIFVLGSSMQKMEVKGEKMTTITYSTTMKLDAAKEREYMFDYVYRQEKEMFYAIDMHGVDWDALSANYRQFLPHINNNYDFAKLLSEWLGELNVSHTGGRYYPEAPDDETSDLGLLFEWDTDGNGLKVAEVLEDGPFSCIASEISPGCVIEKVNGSEVSSITDYITLLNGQAKKKTLVSIYDPSSAKRWDEVVIPIKLSRKRELLYERWVKQRAADVDRWSNGRLGYVHIEAMDDQSFRKLYSDVLGKYNNREGIVIDTRWNGGGRLHEDIEAFFSGQKYLTQVVRGVEVCDMPSRRWNKPSIMVQCEANYSNAHGTPWVYQHQGLGKLVGMPVPGTMTSVNWVTLQDPSLVFGIPVTGYLLPDGSYLENKQLEPDIKVANDPSAIVSGEDTQLRTAVEALLREIDRK